MLMFDTRSHMTMDVPNKLKWNILKYARLVKHFDTEENQQAMREPETRFNSTQEKWDDYSSVNNDLELVFNQDSLYLTVTKERLVLESIFLMNEKEFLHVTAKGDSILFYLKRTDFIRKFRVQFHHHMGRNGIEQCEYCLKVLSKYVGTKVMRASVGMLSEETSMKTKLKGSVSLSDMVKFLAEPSKLIKNRAFATEPGKPQNLMETVMLCLSDPTFPSFVEEVEKCLQKVNGVK